MSQVIQGKCPRCQKVLRIPADWVSRPIRCKFCKQVFQGKSRSSPNPAMVPGGEDTEDAGPMLINRSSRVPRGSKWKKGILITGVFVLLIGSVAVLVGPRLWKNFRNSEAAGAKVVQNAKGSEGEEPVLPKKSEVPLKSKKEESPTKKTTEVIKKKPETPSKPLVSRGEFPRRALLIGVGDYLLLNPLFYGNPSEKYYPGSSTGALASQFTRPPLNISESQIVELSDGIPEDIGNKTGQKAKAPLKQVIETTLIDFLASSRPQDRIVILFAGHAVDIDKESYLIPIEGNKEEAKTLIPLAWVYEKLGKCAARQKVLILDLCRFPPARGFERPGTGEMSEQLDTLMKQPPPGVQVWCSCVKGQQSIELEKGSIFLQALCAALQKGVRGIQEPTYSLPLDSLVVDVNQRMKEILGPQKLDQVSRLAGKEAGGGVPYNPDEPMPPRFEVKPPTVEGDTIASSAQVKNILEEINLFPPVRAQQAGVKTTHLPPFPAKVLDQFKADYKDWKELETMVNKEPEKYPLRKAILEAIKVLAKSQSLVMEEKLVSPGGSSFDPKVKEAFLNKQKDPGLMIFELEKALSELKEAGEGRDKESSKRWQANFDYALARLQSRLVYIYEYNYLLGQIRADNLPALEPIHNGWRLGSRPKVQVNESKVKDMVKSIGRTWKKIAEQYSGTPWAILATRENLTALGMEWRPSRD